MIRQIYLHVQRGGAIHYIFVSKLNIKMIQISKLKSFEIITKNV